MKRALKGFTLVEMVMTIVIISIALVASLQAFSTISGRSADGMVQTRTLDLAQLYLDEILNHRFDEDTGTFGIPTYTGACRITDDGEAREDYDDVDDFNDVSNEIPSFIDSSIASEYNGFRVSISVSCANSIGINSGGAKLIQISISNPIGQTSVFAAYKGNY